MATYNFDYPSINVEKKSNEQNMQTTKGYLSNMSDQLNYAFENLESRIAALESQIASLKEK